MFSRERENVNAVRSGCMGARMNEREVGNLKG